MKIINGTISKQKQFSKIKEDMKNQFTSNNRSSRRSKRSEVCDFS